MMNITIVQDPMLKNKVYPNAVSRLFVTVPFAMPGGDTRRSKHLRRRSRRAFPHTDGSIPIHRLTTSLPAPRGCLPPIHPNNVVTLMQRSQPSICVLRPRSVLFFLSSHPPTSPRTPNISNPLPTAGFCFLEVLQGYLSSTLYRSIVHQLQVARLKTIMAPIGALLTMALLALGGVDAKKKYKITYSYYPGSDCNGHPIGGDLFDLTFTDRSNPTESECTSLNAGGIRFHEHWKNKYNGWRTNAATGQWKCGVRLYKDHGCHSDDVIADLSLPADLTSCHALPADKFPSIQFWCGDKNGSQGRAAKTQSSIPGASYSTAANGQAHASVHMASTNDMSNSYQSEGNITEYSKVPRDDHHIAAHALPTYKTPPQPRADHNPVHLWMKHPWVDSIICYLCWTDHKSMNSKFGCESKPQLHGEVDCGEMPLPVPPTSTHLVTHTTTAEVVYAVTDQFHLRPTPVLEQRSPHRAVALQHPYFPDRRVCADAEWESKGESDQKIQIKHPKDIKKCRKKTPVNLDIGIPEKIVNSVIIETVFSVVTVQPQTTYTTAVPLPVVVTTQSVIETSVQYETEYTSTIQAPTIVSTTTTAPWTTTSEVSYITVVPVITTVTTEVAWPKHY